MFSRITDLPVNGIQVLTSGADEEKRVNTLLLIDTSLSVLEVAALASMQSKGSNLFVTIEADPGELPFIPDHVKEENADTRIQ